MTKFKLNARFFGGAGLIIVILLIIIPVWLGLLEAGVGEGLSQNLVQFRDSEPPSGNPIPFIIATGIAVGVLFLVLREKKKRTR